MSSKTTWRKEIAAEMKGRHETWADVVGCTLSEDQLDAPFDSGYGGSEGAPFTLWTGRHVYFPVVYDGAEWAGSVPRHPCDEATKHLGSE